MDRFDKRENINNFQYLETKLDYINYENRYFSNQIDVERQIQFEAGSDSQDTSKQLIKVSCVTILKEVEQNEIVLDMKMESTFLVNNTIDLKNSRKLVEENKEIKKFLTIPVLSETSLMIGFITKYTFEVPSILSPYDSFEQK